MIKTAMLALVTAALLAAPTAAAPAPGGEPAFRAILKELVETDTSWESGNCTTLAEKIAARMKAAGFPEGDIHPFVPAESPKSGGLVAIYPGRDPKLKAVLLLGHIDVVNARRADWTRDPFMLIEENGYLLGRGVADMKGQVAIWIDSLLRYRAAHYRPLRTIKLALTCGEESGGFVNGAHWLVDHQRDLIDAGITLNEGGYGELDDQGRPVVQDFQAAQKVSTSFTLETTNPGGHSSLPRPDNAIYSLARALDRLSRFNFPVTLNDASRRYFAGKAKLAGGAEAQAMRTILANPEDKAAGDILNRNPFYHSVLRTTCVATMLSGGHAPNALPQRASATVNCRMVPGMTPDQAQAALAKAIDDPEVKLTNSRSFHPMSPSPLTPVVLRPAETLSAKIWPGVPVVPFMAPGATDAVWLVPAGIPTYGVSGMFRDPDGNGVHGLNERIRVRSLMDSRAYLFDLVKAYADQK